VIVAHYKTLIDRGVSCLEQFRRTARCENELHIRKGYITRMVQPVHKTEL
jgi:hypothetical protein